MQVSVHVQDVITEAMCYASLEHKPDVCAQFSNETIEEFEAGLDRNLLNIFNQVCWRAPASDCESTCRV